jgi:hypothetical protein
MGGLFHFFIYAGGPFVNHQCGAIFVCRERGLRLSGVLMSYAVAKASPQPSIAQRPKSCFWLVHCIFFLNQKSVTPAFDHSIGGGLDFDDMAVMLAFLL